MEKLEINLPEFMRVILGKPKSSKHLGATHPENLRSMGDD